MNLVSHIDEQARAVDRNPTDGQKEAGNYRKGHVKVHGLDVSIENPRGSWRTGGPEGKKWKAKLPHHYGYIRRTEGADGDHVDVYLGPHLKSPHVFVIDQHHLHGNKPFDEHKCFIGFGSKVQAREAYHRAFSDGKGHDRIGHIETMTVDGFKDWLKNGDTMRPIKGQNPIRIRKRADGGGISDDDQAAMMPETFNPIPNWTRQAAQKDVDTIKNIAGGVRDIPPWWTERRNGGAVQRMADGGVPAFDEARGPDAAGPPPFDEARGPDKPVGSMSALGRGAIQGATFNFADELRAIDEAGGASPEEPGTPLQSIKGLYKYWTGDPEAVQRYNEALARERAIDEAAKAQHPYLHMAGELAGSIPAMAVLPGGELAEGANLATKMVKGAQVGAEYGGLSGLGEGKDTGERALGAAQGIVGGIIGGAAAPALGSAASYITDRAISPAIGAIRGAINPEAEASRRLAAALQKDQELIAAGKADGMSPQEWIAARKAGEPVTLADLGSSNTQALLRSSANTSPEGRAILEKALNDRFAGQTERVGEEVRGLVAGGANAGKTAEELVADYDRARVPAYKQAFQQGDKEIISPAIERLMGSPTFEQAMKNAVSTGKDRAIAEGYGAFNPGVAVENGMIKFTKTKPTGVPQYPNLQYWDAVKKELDSMANVARRQGDTSSVAGNLAATLRNELDQQVPSYANARGIAAQFFGENNALEAGRKLAGKKVDPAQITQIMSKMKPDEKKLFQEGYASDWANRVIGNISDTRDITKAMFNSPNERARALAVFGPAGMAKMEARMALETIMDGARKAMGNSTTARQLIEAGLAGGTLEGYLSGWDPTRMAEGAAGAAGARKFLGSEMAAGARTLVGKVDSRTARLVAELLTSNDPTKLAQGMRMAQKNQRISEGLKNIANRVALGGQAQGSAKATRLVISPWQGPGPAPGRAPDEQQQPPGVIH